MQLIQKHGAFIFGGLLSIALVTYACKFPFFWDTIQLGSEQANWFYGNNFQSLLLPDQIDSGHFPLFGILLSLVWTCFGQSLIVSHFFMLPFLVMIVYYLLQIGELLTDQAHKHWFLLLLFCNPFFLGQAVLISPDIVLLAFLCMFLTGFLKANNALICISTIGLSLISMRGLILVFILLLWGLYQTYFIKERKVGLLWLLPGIILGLGYQVFHYVHKGWFVFHESSPWSGSFETIYQLEDLLRNIGIYIWRLVDFGNVFLWMALLILIVNGRGRKSIKFSLLWISVIVLGLVTIPKAGLLNHRYYLPIVLVLVCTVLDLLYKSSFVRKKIIIVSLCLLSLSGNLWKYPDGTAQGWDSTLAHLPYYALMDDAIQYLNANNIDINNVGTAFPAKNRMSDLYLIEDNRSFKSFDLDNDEVILYSNVMNDFDTEHIFELDNLWIPVFQKKKGHVVVVIYQKK